MGKVAIVGVEGSGKTVLMAGLCECFKQVPGSDEPYLMPENQAAFKFMETVPYMLRVKHQWPAATSIDNLRAMRWTYRCGDEVLETVELLDYPGELYRLAFGDAEEVRKEELESKRDEVKKFLDHLIDADTLLVLLNLSDVINLGENHKNLETVWITRGILAYAKRLANIKHTVLVFTQADRYAAELQAAGGPQGLYANRLPMLKTLFPSQEVMAVSAVDHIEGNGLPGSDYRPDACLEVMRLILREADTKAQLHLAECQKMYETLMIPTCDGDIILGLENQYQNEIQKFQVAARLFRGYYSRQLDVHTEMAKRFCAFTQLLMNMCGGLDIDRLSQKAKEHTIWSVLKMKFPELPFIDSLHAYLSKIREEKEKSEHERAVNLEIAERKAAEEREKTERKRAEEREESERIRKQHDKILIISVVVSVLCWFGARMITTGINNRVLRKGQELADNNRYKEAIDHVRHNGYGVAFLRVIKPEPPPEWAIQDARILRVNELLADARVNLTSNNWSSAIATAESILAIDRENTEATKIKNTAAGTRKRAENIETGLKRARVLMENSEWAELVACCSKILELDESIRAAIEWKREAEVRIAEDNQRKARLVIAVAESNIREAAKQKAEKERQEVISKRLADAKSAKEQKKWEEVILHAQGVLEMDTANEVALKLKSESEFNVHEVEKQKAEKERQEVIRKRLEAAKSAKDQNNLKQVILLAQSVLEMDTANEEALKLKSVAELNIREVEKQKAEKERQEVVSKRLADAKSAKEKKKWEEVILHAQGVLERDTNNELAKSFKAEAEGMLEPNILVKAQIEGTNVIANLTFGSDTFKTPMCLRVRDRLLYKAQLYCSTNGIDYVGYLSFRVDWKGVKEFEVALSNNKYTPVGSRNWKSPSTGMDFIWIPALKLWVGKYEVTNEEYRKMTPSHDSGEFEGYSLNAGFIDRLIKGTSGSGETKMYTLNSDRQPVVKVNFDDSKKFAQWMTQQDGGRLNGVRYRLPSESEWQIFAQCGITREYPWGDAMPPKYGNYCGQETKGVFQNMIVDFSDGYVATSLVEKSGKNEWDLYGVGGNVWECCASDAAGTFFGAWRGASWSSYFYAVMNCYGRADSPKDYACGFRLVLSQP